MTSSTARRIRAVAAGLVLATALSVSSLAGQVYVTGTVITHETLEPIPFVTVSLLDDDGEVISNRVSGRDGSFSFAVPETGRVSLRAERIGYETVVTPSLKVDRFRSMELELRMSARAVPLAPLEVVLHVPRETSPFLTEFEHRRQRGFGQYIGREQIERRNPTHVTDLLRDVPGLRVVGNGRGRGTVTTARGASIAGGACPAQIYVDGFHVNRADGFTFRVDDVVQPNEVVGIEVYRGLSGVPPEFLSPRAKCGVVAIWTRRGGGRSER